MNVTREMNLNANGGVLYEYGNEYIVRGVLSTDRVDQLARAVVRGGTTSGSAPILLEDIADVHIGAKLPETGHGIGTGQGSCIVDCYQTTVYQHPGPNGETGGFLKRLTEEPAGGCKGQHRHLPPKPFYRKLYRKRTESHCLKGASS